MVKFLRFRGMFLVASVVGLAGCAAVSPGEPDILIDHGGPPGISLSVERTGVLFGSIGFAPRNLSVSAMSVQLRSLEAKGHLYEVFATNRAQHVYWREPDVDTEAQRLWVFAGRVPAGRYEIAGAGVSGANVREVRWIHFKPAIPVTVTADGAAYLGRWQLSPAVDTPEAPQLRVPGTDWVLRDTPEEDQVILARRRSESPIGHRAIDDVLRDLVQRGGT